MRYNMGQVAPALQLSGKFGKAATVGTARERVEEGRWVLGGWHNHNVGILHSDIV